MTNQSIHQRYGWLPVLVIMMAAVALAAGAIGIYSVEAYLVGLTGEHLALAAAQIANTLDQSLYARYADTLLMAQASTFQQNDRTAIEALLGGVKAIHPYYLWLGVTDVTGRIVAATDPGTVGLERGKSAWFRAVRDGERIHLGDAEPSEETAGMDAISFSAAIRGPRGEFLGVLSTRLGLPVLEEIQTQTIRFLQTRLPVAHMVEYQFLTREGNVFIDSDMEHKGNVNFKTLGITSARLVESGQPGYIEEEHLRRHAPVITGYARTQGYRDFPGFQWGVLLRLDRGGILAPMRTHLWELGLAGAVVWVPMLGLLLWSAWRLQKEWAQAQRDRANAEESEGRYLALLESTGEGIYGMDLQGRCTFINRAAARMIGVEPEEVLGRDMHEQLHHHRTDGSFYPVEECPIYHAFLKGEECRIDSEVFWRQDGTSFPAEYSSHPIKDRDTITGAVAVFADITERKRVEDSLKLQSRVLESMTEGVSLADEQGIILYTNPAKDAMFGYQRGELISKHVTVLNAYSPEENARIVGDIIEQLKTRGTWVGEFSNRRKDGTPFATFARISALEISNKKYWVSVQENITERKHVEEALCQSEQHLWELLAERESLVQDLHDGLIQTIYAIGLGLEECQQLIREDSSKAIERLQETVAGLNEVIREVRSSIAGSVPLALNGAQLEAALARLARMLEISGKFHIALTVDALAADRLTPSQTIQVLQVARESISNSLRHSGGRQCTVSLQMGGECVRLQIADDGAGFDLDAVGKGGYGLLNLAVRAHRLNSHLQVFAQAGQGTRIALDIPLSQSEVGKVS